MGSLEDRVRRLQGRITPPLTPPPGMDLVLRLMDHRRRELDAADRTAEAGGRGRLDEAAEPPEPLELSLAEKKLLLEGYPRWLAYLAAQRERASADLTHVIAEAEQTSRVNAERLGEEIRQEEKVKGENE